VLRWGLAGTSDIAATRMVPAMRRAGHVISAVSGRTRERAAEFATAQGVGAWTNDVAELAARDDVDAVYVSTPNALHCAHTLTVAAAGKHVLCEKPVALDLVDARSMVGECAAAGVVLAVNHHLPAHTTHTEIRRLVAAGAVGRPQAVRIFHAYRLAERLRGWRLTDAEAGGPVLDLVPHDASVANTLVGEPLEVAALEATVGSWQAAAGDAAMAVVRYEGDVLCQIHLGWTVPHARTGIEVHGSEGSIVAEGVMQPDPVGSVVLHDAAGAREIALPERRDPYEVTVQAVAAAAAGTSRPVVDGAGGLLAVAVALAVREAARSGRVTAVRRS
jgi:1,5-anhydro-D-fructose reductase (1,5-anhydro-D-mannitol-forming)